MLDTAVSTLHSLWLNDISSWGQIAFCVIHQLMDIWVVSTSAVMNDML
jgi:hypothetical protein